MHLGGMDLGGMHLGWGWDALRWGALRRDALANERCILVAGASNEECWARSNFNFRCSAHRHLLWEARALDGLGRPLQHIRGATSKIVGA